MCVCVCVCVCVRERERERERERGGDITFLTHVGSGFENCRTKKMLK